MSTSRGASQAIEQHDLVAGRRPSAALVVLTAPLIYCMAVPLAILDLAVTLYQALCFPVYGIARVRRSDYFVFDRARLPYLRRFERFNCAYCSYANGLLAYVREIAARTEQYWCAIKHARPLKDPHERYPSFAKYGDASEFDAVREELRDRLSAEDD